MCPIVRWCVKVYPTSCSRLIICLTFWRRFEIPIFVYMIVNILPNSLMIREKCAYFFHDDSKCTYFINDLSKFVQLFDGAWKFTPLFDRDLIWLSFEISVIFNDTWTFCLTFWWYMEKMLTFSHDASEFTYLTPWRFIVYVSY